MDKVDYDTISVVKGAHCKDCGWPIIDACCNGDFTNFKDSKEWDWWNYCSNKNCKNHGGEGVFQDLLDWIVYRDEYWNRNKKEAN